MRKNKNTNTKGWVLAIVGKVVWEGVRYMANNPKETKRLFASIVPSKKK